MPQRLRKLLGTAVFVVFITFYSLLAMTIGAAKLPGASGLVQFFYFLVAGLAWVLPAMPLIAWMQKPDAPAPR